MSIGLTLEKFLKAKEELLSKPWFPYSDEEFKHLDRMIKIRNFALYKCLQGKNNERVDWQEIENYLKEEDQLK